MLEVTKSGSSEAQIEGSGFGAVQRQEAVRWRSKRCM